jgi:hypothetical protein
MNKHVSKLSKEAGEARRMLEDSESESEDSDDPAAGEKKRNGSGNHAVLKLNPEIPA